MLGFGVHEGDWEFVQIGLDADGAPEVATYAQHGGGERCAWSQLQRTADGATVVYVALASHASYPSSGVNPRGFYPDDHHRSGGYQVRPALEIVTGATPFMASRGRWGASSSSPVAPRRQAKWGDPAAFHANAAACTVGTAQSRETASALPSGSEVAAPAIDVRREGARAVVRYAFGREPLPDTLLVSVARAGEQDRATARRVRLRGRRGVTSLRVPPATAGPYVVTASAFARRGSRSTVVSAALR